ncbi:MAG: PKD domain-containing protein, partial [Solirubrobacteraceae bacterium]
MPIQVLRIAAVLGVLAVSGFGAPALASPHTQLPLRARPAQAGSLQVHLKVSDHHPRQFVGVLFNAVASRGDGAAYFFDYGDGVTESSYQPLAMHGYRHAGTFRARVGVIERGGQAAASA